MGLARIRAICSFESFGGGGGAEVVDIDEGRMEKEKEGGKE